MLNNDCVELYNTTMIDDFITTKRKSFLSVGNLKLIALTLRYATILIGNWPFHKKNIGI